MIEIQEKFNGYGKDLIENLVAGTKLRATPMTGIGNIHERINGLPAPKIKQQ